MSGQRGWEEEVWGGAIAAITGDFRGETLSRPGLARQLLPPGASAADLALGAGGNAEQRPSPLIYSIISGSSTPFDVSGRAGSPAPVTTDEGDGSSRLQLFALCASPPAFLRY